MRRTRMPDVDISTIPIYTYVDISTHPLQLIRRSEPLRRDHTVPFLPPLLRMHVQHVRVDEPGGNAIDATEIDPFD